HAVRLGEILDGQNRGIRRNRARRDRRRGGRRRRRRRRVGRARVARAPSRIRPVGGRVVGRRCTRMALAVRYLPALGLAGCFSPTFLDGKTPCSTDKDCPSGLHCATDKTCWRNGRDPGAPDLSIEPPDLSMKIVETDAALDLAVPSDLEATLDFNQPPS